MSITGKERTVYIEESEDEYLWTEGQTAAERATIIANDWGIPIGYFEDTEIKLSKDKRKESLYSMMKKDLKETAQKDGKLYRFRMDVNLDLFELGSNIFIYELDNIMEELDEKDSLDGAVTQVKVLGKEKTNDNNSSSSKDDSDSNSSSSNNELVLSPIIGTFKKDTETYGTIQKIVQDDKVDDYSKAETKANSLFSNGEASKTINCCDDINTLHAGNTVNVYGEILCITEITHTLGSSNKMSLTVMKMEDVRRKFYSEQ
ncbi:XkdQ/YqbQ family protein [Clostridium saccharobutylicum]|uniref:XkdQ/YqbQ family protein n=1 Tax=Clostridium saccharobutylicum TaxID=169679 RepID=UPI003BF87033